MLQLTQIEGDAILCGDVLTDVTTLTEIINLNCIPSVQVHDTAVTRPLRLALGSATPDYIPGRKFIFGTGSHVINAKTSLLTSVIMRWGACVKDSKGQVM